MDKANAIIKPWFLRELTLYGRILLVKSLIYSLFQYISQVYVIPDRYVKIINNIVWKFINKGKKKFAIKRQVLYKEYEKGGLKMLNFDCLQKSQRIMWIKRFVNDPNSSWATVFNSLFSMYGGFELFIRCNYKVNLLSKNIPLYYRTMLHNWNGIKCNEYMDNFV